MIRQAYADLLGEKKDFTKITVSEIAEKADIAKSTFYNHYDDLYCVAEEFENELISKLSDVLDEVEEARAVEYSVYIKKIIEFLKENEEVYRRAIVSSDIRFFIEKLKNIISKKVFENNSFIPPAVSEKSSERYVQIRFLTNACVDTMADYFKGALGISLDETGEIILAFLNRFISKQ